MHGDTSIVSRWSRPAPGVPWMTLLLAVVMFLLMALLASVSPMAEQAIIDVAGMRPSRVAAMWSLPLSDWPGGGLSSLFTAVLIHLSWLHLAGNLAYLWVFGMPLERRLGALGLLSVFLLGGALANAVVALRLPGMETAIIGSSGAVSAVVGAYLALFPSRRIGLYVPLGLYVQFARVPALLVIGSWFTLQLVYTVFDPISGSVAWWTHLAGFTLGIMFGLLARAFAQVQIG